MNWSTEWKSPVASNVWEPDNSKIKNIWIKVKGKDVPVTVPVTVIGDLGLDFDENGWNIYHLPTLACFDEAVPESNDGYWLYDKQLLLNWMVKIQSPFDICYEFERPNTSPINVTGAYIRKAWKELRVLTPENYLTKGDRAKEIIQKWCLSVKVE